jgi:general secretion pathway protein D
MQKIKMEESALKRARELTEEKMMLDVAKKHILPDVGGGRGRPLLDEKKITPIVRVPEIRRRLKIPISVDFKDVGLDYVLNFLSDATGVNIVPSSGIDMAEKKVTIKIKEIPLEEALRYILKSQDLVYRIEEDAVWVATKDEIDNEKIDTRVYFLDQGIGRFAEFTTVASSSADKGESESGSSVASAEVKTLKNILENSVEWPKDSRLTMDERTGALIISNTPSNLETVENLLYNLDITPMQVLIEARFLEVKVTDLDDIGVEWKLNSIWGMDQNRAGNTVYGFAKNSGSNFSDFSNDTKDQGFNLTYQGILSNPQFQAVLHALQEKQNVKTLSAPRITTLNNQTATIEVVDEYIYPTRYEASLVQYDINGDGDFDDAGETEWVNVPQDFVTRNVGILLHVKPSVGVDKRSITLAMTPEVSEDAGRFTYPGSVSIPKFTTRNLSTSVIVKNGETVVLGGLIKETNTNVKSKVPILGDIPILGGLFKKSTDSKERRNLLIFVTASVMEEKQNKVASAEDIEKEILKQ